MQSDISVLCFSHLFFLGFILLGTLDADCHFVVIVVVFVDVALCLQAQKYFIVLIISYHYGFAQRSVFCSCK